MRSLGTSRGESSIGKISLLVGKISVYCQALPVYPMLRAEQAVRRCTKANAGCNKENAMRRTEGLLGMILVLLLAGTMQTGAQPAKVPKGKIVLAWHTNMASKWLDPQEHDGTATPDNFLNALHDALIKNSRETLFDHPALAERYAFASDAKSATFWLRPGIKFHNGEPVTVEDVVCLALHTIGVPRLMC